jgi:hypothetical protein
MTDYIAIYQKKHKLLREHERSLAKLLKSDAAELLVLDAAQTVRKAQIRALKEERQKLTPAETKAPEYVAIARTIQWWTDAPTATIIDGYRTEAGRTKLTAAIKRAVKVD